MLARDFRPARARLATGSEGREVTKRTSIFSPSLCPLQRPREAPGLPHRLSCAVTIRRRLLHRMGNRSAAHPKRCAAFRFETSREGRPPCRPFSAARQAAPNRPFAKPRNPMLFAEVYAGFSTKTSTLRVQGHPLLRTRDLMQRGFDRVQLRQAVEAGLLEHAGRGLYCVSDADIFGSVSGVASTSCRCSEDRIPSNGCNPLRHRQTLSRPRGLEREFQGSAPSSSTLRYGVRRVHAA